MTELLYQRDAYLREFEATVTRVTEEGVILDRTAFLPRSGGLESDTGVLVGEREEFRVNYVRFVGEGVLHQVDRGLREGERVRGILDWEQRYRKMRLHTAAHILSAVLYEKTGALITGGHITPERAYGDYSVDELTEEAMREAVEEANEVVRRGVEVKVYWLPREEALKIEGVVKLAGKNPPPLEVWRIVEIPGVDIQADGGPHVRNTKEVGEIVFLKRENKGKGRKRIYYTVRP